MIPARRQQSFRHRRGTVLIVAMVVTFALAGMAIALCRSMATEAFAAANHAAAVQAAAVERGAEQYVMAVAADPAQPPTSLDESQFAAVPVGAGYFWVLRPDYGDAALPAFGLTDEAGKVDINNATYDQLMRLPLMTEEVAASIVDWRDEDETVTGGGGESPYYQTLPQPYACKNAPFETVEELLLVKGVTPQLLYGDGTAGAAAAASSTSASSSSGTAGGAGPDEALAAARGLFDLLTVHSVTPAATGGSGPGGGQTPLNRGRLNVNTAPRDALLTLDDLDVADVDKLLAARGSLSTATDVEWAATALGARFTNEVRQRVAAQSYRYSADLLAVSGNGRAFRRVRVVVDVSGTAPRLLYRRDLTSRGWPLDRQVLTALRAGQGPGTYGTATIGGVR